MKFFNIFKDIINSTPKRIEEEQLIIATVSTLSPLKVEVITDDNEIEVVPTTGLNGVSVGSRVVLQKFLNQYIAIAILGDSSGSAPIATVNPYAGSSAPTGWVLCDGSAISRTTYSDLFAVISTTYGTGDGSTTFNVPNLKGKVPVGYNSSESEFNTLGETGGAKTHTLSISQMPSHGHTQNSHTHTVRYKAFDGLSAGSTWNLLRRTDGSDSYDGTDSDAANSKTATNQSTGGGGSHNNLQPYIALNYIIKY